MWLKKLVYVLEGKEEKFIEFIKNNRTKGLLEFFRKHSAVIVVLVTTMLVSAGNINSHKTEEGGFLASFFQKEISNQEKIAHLVKSQTFNNNLSMVPLAIASASNSEEDMRAMMAKDGNLSQNQMQYQVMTATTPPNAKDLLDQGSDVAVYEVQDGDTVSTVAQKFNVTTNTIMWANDIDDVDMIRPGDKIFILPTTGVQHVCKNGDTIDSIAKKYDAEKEKIIAFNSLPADGEIKEGLELIIPDGRIEQAPAATTPDSLLNRRNYYSSSQMADGGPAASQGDDSGTARKPSVIDRNPKGGHRFPYGQCTWYVAQRKYVPWGGNAGTWLYHAKAYGASTGKTPKVGAILVTSESWYGHVAVVEKVSGGQITISEMNYVGFAKKSTRTLSTGSRVIKGYIY